MGAMEELGAQAVVLSVGSVAGSVLVAAVVAGRFFNADEE